MRRALLCLALLGCEDVVEVPAPEACGPDEPVLCPVGEAAAAQPLRQNPTAVVVDTEGRLAYVALTGSEAQPGETVVVVDVASAQVVARVPVGPRPVGLALHPSGRWLVVASSFARSLSIIDTAKQEVVARARLTFYAEDLVFSADGATLLVTDRQNDGVWRAPFAEAALGEARFIPLGNNPSQIDLCPGGRDALITLMGEGRLARLRLDTEEVDYLDLEAPPNDVLCLGETAVVATLGAGRGLPAEGTQACADARATGDMDCDETAAIRFADIQNELALVEVASLQIRARYTSDTAEQSRTDPAGAVPPDQMRVGGAFPRRLTRAPGGLWVSYAASGQVQRFDTELRAGEIHEVGFAPEGLAVTAQGTLVVANRLSEDLSVIEAGGSQRRVGVGTMEPRFPATDEEVGELFFFSAWFSSDGDGSCSHCHPDAATDGKAWSVATVPLGMTRQVPPTRNLGATLPLLLEGTQDQNGFNLEMEDLSPRLDYDPDPSADFERGRAARDTAFRTISQARFGREVGFDEMVALVGRFLVSEPRLLPNPHPQNTPEVERGRALYTDPAVACAACHPIGAFTTNEQFAEVIATRAGDRPNEEIPASIALDFLKARAGVFDTPSLRGLWDRPGRFLHDGRASSLTEAILTPEHPALAPGEQGFNFGGGRAEAGRLDHSPDTHGGVSHLRVEEVADLLAYLRTIE